MPRDLTAAAQEIILKNMPQLTDENAIIDESRAEPGPEASPASPKRTESKLDELHPYTQTLNLTNVESCLQLEEATFPPQERCTREKFRYRLETCGELSMGIFTSDQNGDIATAETSAPVSSSSPRRKAVLLGHIIATKTTSPTVTDDDMALPTAGVSDPAIGHKEAGRTVCIHSLAVLPQFQRRGLGQTLIRAYLDRIETHGVADRAALIAHEHLIPFYQNLGFENKGKSSVGFGGGGWYDMIIELDSSKEIDSS